MLRTTFSAKVGGIVCVCVSKTSPQPSETNNPSRHRVTLSFQEKNNKEHRLATGSYINIINNQE